MLPAVGCDTHRGAESHLPCVWLPQVAASRGCGAASGTGMGRGPAPALLAVQSRDRSLGCPCVPAPPPQLRKLGAFDIVVSVQLSEMW